MWSGKVGNLMCTRLIPYVVAAFLGAEVSGPVHAQETTLSQGRPAAMASEDVVALSGDYFVLAFVGRRVVSSGTMSLILEDDGSVSGTWDVDYESTDGDTSRYPAGDGDVTGKFDASSETLWLFLGGTLNSYTVVHRWGSAVDNFTVFRGSYSFGGLDGPTYGGLFQISDREEPAIATEPER